MLAPDRPHHRAGWPPSGSAPEPPRQGSPSPPPRATRLLPFRAAVHAHEGVDRLIIVPVAHGRLSGEEPRRQDRRQGVEMPREHPGRGHRAGLVAAATEEPAYPDGGQRRTVTRNDDVVPAHAVTPEVQSADRAGGGTAPRAGPRTHRVDRWKGRPGRGRVHAPGAPSTGTGRGRSLVAWAPPPFPGIGGPGADRLRRREHTRHGRGPPCRRAGRAQGTANRPDLGWAPTPCVVVQSGDVEADEG